MSLKYACLVVCLLAVFAGPAAAVDCGSTDGDYVIRLSGFGGGSPIFYPIAIVGNMTVDKGAVTGNYKLITAVSGGTKENKNVTGKLSVKSCAGTLTFQDGARTTHTFTVLVGKEGNMTLAAGDIGLVVSGTAEK